MKKIENLSFKGKKLLYNKQYHGIGNVCAKYNTEKPQNICGEKLLLVSR